MSTSPFVDGRFRAFDSNGNPLSGGLLYTYLAGTTTPQSTYTDSAGGTPNANPVVLDSQGYADVWLSSANNYKFVLKDSGGSTQWTVDNFPPSAAGASPVSTAQTTDPGGRLSIASANAAPAFDVLAVGTIYYLPYRHDQIPLFDGTTWALHTIGAGISQATTDNTKSPAAVAANSAYDLFAWNDNGTIRLSRGPAWPTNTSRGTGVGTTQITFQNGRLVNQNAITNGPGALLGLYLGTVLSNASSLIDDSFALRHVWNNYNRVRRPMAKPLTAGAYAYATAAWRAANNDSANQLSFVLGLAEDAVTARVQHCANPTDATFAGAASIGLDSVSAVDSACIFTYIQATDQKTLTASWEGFTGQGVHSLVFLEYGSASASFAGASGATGVIQSGIQGELRA